jgi:aminoglycoside phosphotransferase (APT) family kinase protein
MERVEHDITADLIRELLREQHPDLADLPVELGARGWSNQLWRLGDELAVRIPWATGAGGEVRREHAWLPTLAPRLPLPVPVPRRLGEPSERFPDSWIVTTWVPGEPADRAPVTRGAEAADALAGFLAALHRPAPDEGPEGYRGLPLAVFGEHFPKGLATAADSGLIADPAAVRAIWDDAVAAPVWDGPRLWLHGDLHPANVLTRDGMLCGVIDFGDLATGDPAADLGSPWILLPDGYQERFYSAYRSSACRDQAGCGPALEATILEDTMLRRARGWAVLKAVAGINIGHDDGPGGKPTWGPPGQAALKRLIAAAR